MTKRRILLVDDEITVLLTLKAVLEISGFDVDTAASAREGKSRIAKREYDMIITDMRMESDAAGVEVIKAARNASYRPAVALLTAFPMSDEDQLTAGADKMLIKPMQTRILLQQIDRLLTSHGTKMAKSPIPRSRSTPFRRKRSVSCRNSAWFPLRETRRRSRSWSRVKRSPSPIEHGRDASAAYVP